MTNLKHMLQGWYVLFYRSRQAGGKKFRPDREKLIYPFRLLIHPIEVFNDLKYENKASFPLTFLLVFLFFAVRLLERVKTAYLFNPDPDENFSLWAVLAGSVGIVLLWTVCNWAMCTLTGGEGTVKDIWTATAYSLMPLIMLGALNILLSAVFSSDEAIIYSTVAVIKVGWTLLLVFLGTLTVHQYTVKKTVAAVIYTLLAMLALCFLLLLCFSIIQQIQGFASSLYREILYR